MMYIKGINQETDTCICIFSLSYAFKKKVYSIEEIYSILKNTVYYIKDTFPGLLTKCLSVNSK